MRIVGVSPSRLITVAIRPLLSINRPVEDLIRNRGFVNELVGEVPFHELGAATKHPNDGPSWKTGRAAAAVWVRIGPPRRDTRMTDGHAVAGVARGRNVGGVVEVERIQFILFPHLPLGSLIFAQLVGSPLGACWQESR